MSITLWYTLDIESPKSCLFIAKTAVDCRSISIIVNLVRFKSGEFSIIKTQYLTRYTVVTLAPKLSLRYLLTVTRLLIH